MNINQDLLTKSILELIRLTSTTMSQDVVDALLNAKTQEDDNSVAEKTLEQILKNIDDATCLSTPICQDTGTNIYYVTVPEGTPHKNIKKAIIDATKQATEKTFLRPNAVDSITDKNSGDNTGVMAPYISFDEWDKDEIQIKLMLKGGGSENVSQQYKLPNTSLNAGRNLNGIYKCVIDAIYQAQGLGCAPGIIGVGIGGDRATGMITAKKQLFRLLNDVNENPQLAELEEKLYKDINSMKIGPMGFGGKTTVLSVKAGALHRLPASFFVSIAYMCWACRRKTLTFSNEGVRYD